MSIIENKPRFLKDIDLIKLRGIWEDSPLIGFRWLCDQEGLSDGMCASIGGVAKRESWKKIPNILFKKCYRCGFWLKEELYVQSRNVCECCLCEKDLYNLKLSSQEAKDIKEKLSRHRFTEKIINDNYFKKIMNLSRFNQIHKNLSIQAQKAYKAIPMDKPWDVAQILREMNRIGHSNPKSNVMIVINQLIDTGLITQPTPGLFIRVKVKSGSEDIIKTETTQPMQEELPIMAENTKKQDKNPMDILVSLSEMANKIVADVNAFKAEIEKAAIDIEERFIASEEKSKQLIQLKQLLHGIVE